MDEKKPTAANSNGRVLQVISSCGVVPVIAIDSVEAALPLADALIEGGLPLAEITFRTPAAAEVIEKLHWQRPELLVGAGTVLTNGNLKVAKACGAKFCVAPGLNPNILEKARRMRMPFIPGVCNPSDIEQGLSRECTVLKFFPAEAAGGVKMVKALAGPYSHMGLRFMPTGGVNMDNLADYLSLDAVMAVGGTWIAKKEDMTEGRWDDIRRRCKVVVEKVAAIRASG